MTPQHKIFRNLQKRTSNKKNQKRQLPFEYVFVQRRIVATNLYTNVKAPQTLRQFLGIVAMSVVSTRPQFITLESTQAKRLSIAELSSQSTLSAGFLQPQKSPKISMKDRTAQLQSGSKNLGCGGESKSAGETKRSACLRNIQF